MTIVCENDIISLKIVKYRGKETCKSMENKITPKIYTILYFLIHSAVFGCLFYHTAVLIGEVEITADMSGVGGIFLLLSTFAYIFIDYLFQNKFVLKYTFKPIRYAFFITDILLLLGFICVCSLVIWFLVHLSISANNFLEALPCLAVNCSIDIIICAMFIITRVMLLKSLRK